MFTVKATYCGETRKFSFSEPNSFPSFVQLSNQLYRVFPHLGYNYSLSKLLFSPNSSDSRILIGSEVHTAEQYNKCLASPSLAGPWPNPLLKFDVFDEILNRMGYNQTIEGKVGQVPWGVPWRTPPAMSPAGNISLPSCSSQFNMRPLSMTAAPPPLAAFHSPPTSGPGTMECDKAVTPPWCKVPSPPVSQPHNSHFNKFDRKPILPPKPFIPHTPQPTPCCTVTEVKQDMHKTLRDFRKDLDRILETLAAQDDKYNPSSSSSPAKDLPVARCTSCGEPFRGQFFPCINCPTQLCVGCKHFSQPTLCLNGDGHVFPTTNTTRAWSPGPVCVPFIPENSRPVTPFIPPLSSLPQVPTIPRMDGWSTLAPSQPTPDPVSPPKAIHNGVVCDSCNRVIEGIRHKCLDCANYDLCPTCIVDGGAGRHNAFHEFIEIHEPGKVIVHVVGGRDATNFARAPAQSAPAPAAPEAAPAVHNATCDLCDSRILGDRYKCVVCPDFDTCNACFAIVSEQHPQHTFVRLSAPSDLIHAAGCVNIVPQHNATCNVCMQTIRGVRYKCMHPLCPDFDLCDKCETHPISTHPDTHPMLKMKHPETVIPTVYRVGMTTLIDTEDRGRPSTRLSTPLSHKCSSRSPSPAVFPWFPARAEEQNIPGQYPFAMRTPTPPPHVPDMRTILTPSPPPLPPKVDSGYQYSPVTSSPHMLPGGVSPPEVPNYSPQYIDPAPTIASQVGSSSRTTEGYSPAYMNMKWQPPTSWGVRSQSPPSSNGDDFLERAMVQYPPVSSNTSHPSFQRKLSIDELLHTETPKFAPFRCEDPISTASSAFAATPRLNLSDLLSLLQPPQGSPVGHEETFLTPSSENEVIFPDMPPVAASDVTLTEVPPGSPVAIESLSTNEPTGRNEPPVQMGCTPVAMGELEASAGSEHKESGPPRNGTTSSESDASLVRRLNHVSQAALHSRRPQSLIELLQELPPRSRFSVSDVSRSDLTEVNEEVSQQSFDLSANSLTQAKIENEEATTADFVEDITVNDGQVFPPGAEFVKSWRMKNSGRDWDESTELVFVAGESFSATKRPIAPVHIGSVKSGEEIDLYTGELKAPEIPGRYVGYWRLKNATCHLFGASIWIDITVAEHDSSVVQSSNSSSMSSSSIIMPSGGSLDVAKQIEQLSMSTTVAITATSGSTDSDVISLDGSDNSFSGLSAPSSDDDWEDGRINASPNGQSNAVDYVVLYDENASSEEEA